MENQLSLCRKEIDILDFQLLDALAQHKDVVALLNKRISHVEKIAAYKKKQKLPLFDTGREAFLLKTRIAYGKEIGLSEEKVKQFFSNVLLRSHHVIETIFQDKEI